jgi:hypothetical protein
MAHPGSTNNREAPRPLAVVEEEVLAEYGVFTLQAHYSSAIALALGRPSPGSVLRAGRGGATFRSGAFDHFARVRVELWPTRPPALVGEWEDTAEGAAEIDTDELRLASATAWISDHPVRLPYATGGYLIEASVSGRTTVAAHPDPHMLHGIERWLIRVWPVR